MLRVIRGAIILAILAAWYGPARAENLGVYGNVYSIKEPDLLDVWKGKLKKIERTGQLKAWQEKAKQDTLAKLENPPPVPGIGWAKESRSWTFDPTYTVRQTIKDHNGNVIAPAGKTVNPFDFTSLTKALVFIDARDEKQVRWAKERLDKNPRDKLVLVGGSWLKLTRQWKRQIFFDQEGMLTRHFRIKTVPAVLQQQGRVLRIDEVAL